MTPTVDLVTASDLAVVSVCEAFKQFMQEAGLPSPVNGITLYTAKDVEAEAMELQRMFIDGDDAWPATMKESIRDFAYAVDRSLEDGDWYVLFTHRENDAVSDLGIIRSGLYAGLYDQTEQDLETYEKEVVKDMADHMKEVIDRELDKASVGTVSSMIISCGSVDTFDVAERVRHSYGIYAKAKTDASLNPEVFSVALMDVNGNRIGGCTGSL